MAMVPKTHPRAPAPGLPGGWGVLNKSRRSSKELRIKKMSKVFASHRPPRDPYHCVRRCRSSSNIVPALSNRFFWLKTSPKPSKSFKHLCKIKDFGLKPFKILPKIHEDHALCGFAFVLQPTTSKTLQKVIEDYADSLFVLRPKRTKILPKIFEDY